jgi:hypothetical protein
VVADSHSMHVQVGFNHARDNSFSLQIDLFGFCSRCRERFLVATDDDKFSVVDGHGLRDGELLRVLGVGGENLSVVKNPIRVNPRRRQARDADHANNAGDEKPKNKPRPGHIKHLIKNRSPNALSQLQYTKQILVISFRGP